MKKILITGARGAIGTTLQKELQNYSITPLDLLEHDCRDASLLQGIFPGHDAIIHLAWNTKIDHAGSGAIDPGNSQMFYNVYRIALETKVPRVIMASSVHTERIPHEPQRAPLSPLTLPTPNNPYGAHKVFMESLGRYFATQGLEVICLRFGGVHQDNRPSKDPNETWRWLSHRDLGNLVRACIDAPSVPENFAILWGVSRGGISRYDLTNPFGWAPLDETTP